MDLAPGLHRIGNDLIAVHLVVTAEGVTVIDAGLSGHERELRRELAGLGLGIGDLRGIVLTHGDADHLGFAERLRARHGVPVWVHAADAARAKGEELPGSPSWGRPRIGALLRFLGYSVAKGGLRTRHLAEVRTAQDGDVLPLPGAPRVIALPGHSAGSIAVHVPALRALLVGDALTTRNVLTGGTGAQPAPFTDDPEGAHAALARLEGIEADWVLPGHGPVWTSGVPALLAAYRAAVGR